MPERFLTVTSLAATDVIRAIVNPDTQNSQDAKIAVGDFMKLVAPFEEDVVTLKELHMIYGGSGGIIKLPGGGGQIFFEGGSGVIDFFDNDNQINMRGADDTIAINSAVVLRAAKSGWSTATGTATRTTFATSSVTLPQLAERVKALIDDLHSSGGHHGLLKT